MKSLQHDNILTCAKGGELHQFRGEVSQGKASVQTTGHDCRYE
jgi:hypothetical protein